MICDLPSFPLWLARGSRLVEINSHKLFVLVAKLYRVRIVRASYKNYLACDFILSCSRIVIHSNRQQTIARY